MFHGAFTTPETRSRRLVSIGALRKLIKELQAADNREPLAIGGAAEIARTLERELTRGGDSTAVRVGAPEGAALYVHIATGDDEAALRAARRARVPIVAVVFDDAPLPFVLATDVVRVGPGERMPVDRIADAVAARLGERGAPLAGRLPALRGAVCDRIVASFARKNGIVASLRLLVTARADLPVLALNQVRMLLLLDQAYGLELDPMNNRRVAQEIAVAVGAGLGLRTVARELLEVVHVKHWRVALVKGGIAYAGTRALGEAAVRRLELVHATPPRGGALRGAP